MPEAGSCHPIYKRVLLKLSGDAMRGSLDFGIDPERVESISRQMMDVGDIGVDLAVVIGGGNFLRGAQASQKTGISRATADYMGMLATVINGLALQDCLERRGAETRLCSALKAEEVAEPYIRRRALRHIEKGRIVILAGGTGNPYQTTDTTAAVRAMELDCDVLMKATKVDGIYDADPEKNPDAKRFETLSYMEVLNGRLRVMDSTAVSHCMENKLPIIVFSMETEGNIVRAVCGEPIGTTVGA